MHYDWLYEIVFNDDTDFVYWVFTASNYFDNPCVTQKVTTLINSVSIVRAYWGSKLWSTTAVQREENLERISIPYPFGVI